MHERTYIVLPCEFFYCPSRGARVISAYAVRMSLIKKEEVHAVIYHPITKNLRQLGGSNTLDADDGLPRF